LLDIFSPLSEQNAILLFHLRKSCDVLFNILIDGLLVSNSFDQAKSD